MDYRKTLCKCTKCNKAYIDTIPNNHCLRMSEEDLPKEVKTLIEEGCPECLTWDHLEDVTDLITLNFADYKEAMEKGPIEYPGAIYLKALWRTGNGTGGDRENQAYSKLKQYNFVI